MKDLALKLGSLLVAMIIWLITFNVSDSVVSATRDVPLNVINENIMEEAKLDYSLNESYVKVSFKARSQALGGITANDFNAYVDLSQVSKSGATEVYVEVLNGKDNILADVEVKPYVVGVYTEEIQTKDFTLLADTYGEPKENYQIRDISLGDEKVTISGPASEIGRISTAKVTVDVDRIKADRSGEQKIIFYDSNNNVVDIENTKIQINRDKTTYNVRVYKTKEVELHVKVSGKPADGKLYTSFSVVPSSIEICGTPDVIDNIESLDLGTIDISEEEASYTEIIDLAECLSEGTELASLTTAAKVNVNIVEIDVDALIPTSSEASSGETSDGETSDGETSSSSETSSGPDSSSSSSETSESSSETSESEEASKESADSSTEDIESNKRKDG
jgi:YbbR domain-containing protein